jgi:hypothetical protein
VQALGRAESKGETLETVRRPIEELVGVGAALGAALRGAGYGYVEDLLSAEPVMVAEDLDPLDGVTAQTVLSKWIPQARFLRLPALEPSAAAALVQAGLTTYDQIAFLPAGRLGELVGGVAPHSVSGLQLDAAKRRRLATVTLRVVGGDGAPIPGATVESVDPPASGAVSVWTWTADAGGVALLEYLAAGVHELYVRAEGFAERRLVTLLAERSYQTVRVKLGEGTDRLVVDEFVKGVALANSLDPVRRMTIDGLAALPENATPFGVTAVAPDEVSLTCALMRKIGPTREVYSVAVSPSDVPGEVAVGDLLERSESGFVSLGHRSIWSWRGEQLAASEGGTSGG